MLKSVGKALRIISDDTKDKIALIFDVPTLFPGFQLDKLNLLKEALSEIGTTRTGKFVTDRQLSKEDSQLVNDHGFEEEIVASDVDIHVTLNSLEYANSKSFDIVGIATTDSNLFPVFSKIKKSKKLLIITWKKNLTPAMEAVADYILDLDYIM
ncbi:MAG: hypothetical protein ACTSQB_01320 [Candidatus Heimdallarchaeota archaeon]